MYLLVCTKISQEKKLILEEVIKKEAYVTMQK